jgi:hypothetical protein
MWRPFAYMPSGYLVGAYDGGELRAVKLPGAGAAAGKVVTVLKGADTGTDDGDARFDLSQNGTLIYVRSEQGRRSLAIVDRQGQSNPVSMPAGEYYLTRLSPERRRAAGVANFQLKIVDLERGTTTPLVPELESRGAQTDPVWSVDGRSVTFRSNHEGNWNLYSKPATGAGSILPVVKLPSDQRPYSFAPDGTLLFGNDNPQNGQELWMLPPGGDPRVWLSNGATNLEARFSPDGRLVAYSSSSSGRFEVYVQSRDNPADRVQVSAAGGTMPVWSPSGGRLYFRQGNAIMEAAIGRASGLSASTPVRLFDGGWTLPQWYSFDITPDGQHFMMLQQPREAIQTRIEVVLNWFPVLKEDVAGNR